MIKTFKILCMIVLTAVIAGCSTSYKHHIIANEVVFSDEEFQATWQQPKLNADCRIVVNSPEEIIVKTDALMISDRLEYPLKQMLEDIVCNMRDRALTPDNRGASFEIEMSVDEALLKIEESFFTKKVKSNFDLKVYVKFFDTRHNRLWVGNLSSSQEEENIINDKNEFEEKVVNVVYKACKDITEQCFKTISQDRVIMRELKKFD